MMTIPEVENRPLTTQELLDRLPPLPHSHGHVTIEPKASWLTGPLKMKRSNVPMPDKDKANAQGEAVKEIFGLERSTTT